MRLVLRVLRTARKRLLEGGGRDKVSSKPLIVYIDC